MAQIGSSLFGTKGERKQINPRIAYSAAHNSADTHTRAKRHTIQRIIMTNLIELLLFHEYGEEKVGSESPV